jgi:glycosyltransferase involved in cell wall biosynthesis
MLSFIIPTLNEEEHIDALLSSLKPQLKGEDELLIVDSFSKDRTVEVAEGHGARVISQPKSGIGLAKTEGARRAKNDIFVFMDADCRAQDDFAERIRRHFSDPEVLAVGGLDLYSSDSGLWRLLYNAYSGGVFLSSRLNHMISGKYFIPANNSAYRRELFFKRGGFRSVVCEDTDMMLRMPAQREGIVYDSGMKLTLSDRRFKERGFFRTVALWGWSNLVAMLGKGVSTEGYRED